MRTMTQRQWIARVLSIAGLSGAALLSGCDDSATPNPGPDLQVASAIDMATTTHDLAMPTSDASPTVRRPFLVGSSLRVAGIVTREDWRDPLPAVSIADLPTREALAAAWLKDALEEHASVAAFARFAVMGLSVGAPEDIVVDAQRASLDEIKHARACFGLAHRYGAARSGPGPLDVEGAFIPLDLAQIAALTAREGCVGETLGALLAEEQLEMARDPSVVEILGRIVRDERRHAELAWRFVKWAVGAGGASVRREVVTAARDAIAATRAAPIRALQGDLELWHAHGRVTCAEARAVAERGIKELVIPALAALRDDGAADRPNHQPPTASA
jgi:hypothetical protein